MKCHRVNFISSRIVIITAAYALVNSHQPEPRQRRAVPARISADDKPVPLPLPGIRKRGRPTIAAASKYVADIHNMPV